MLYIVSLFSSYFSIGFLLWLDVEFNFMIMFEA